MAIGTTAAYDPTTGERQESQFSYTPVDPTEDMMRQAFERSQQGPIPPQPQGPTPYWENPATYYPRQEQADPVAQSKAATAAAYKYIAFRGYQQDLKEGKSAADAFAKWGPMLVQDVSLAPAMKAMRVQPGRWVQANPETGQPGYYEGQGPSGPRPYFPPESSARMPDVDFETGIKVIDGQKFYQNPRTGSLTRVSQKDVGVSPTAALNIVSDPYKWQFAQAALGDASTNLVNIAKGALPNASPATAQPTAPVTVETAATPASQGTPTVTSKSEFDKLPSGAVYLNKGKLYRKP